MRKWVVAVVVVGVLAVTGAPWLKLWLNPPQTQEIPPAQYAHDHYYPSVNDFLREQLRLSETRGDGEHNRRRSIAVEGLDAAETPARVRVSIAERQLPDDAVEGEIRTYDMQRFSQGWRIISAELTSFYRAGYAP